MSTWWQTSLRCPACRGELVPGDGEYQCPCGLHFPVVRGVPVLLDPSKSLFSPQEVAAQGRTKTERRGLRRAVPSISLNQVAAPNYGHLAELLGSAGAAASILIVGAGEGGEGAAGLTDAGFRVLPTDVALGESTELVLDAHQIPFADDSFDCVVAQAVLEHVLDPWEVVSEIARVLKVGGLVYAETPFMQQVHMAAFDFTRFTPVGHRRLFRQFEEIDSGIAVGPGSALAWSVTYFLCSFPRSRRVRRLVNIASRILFFWLKHFDRVLNSRPGAWDAASGVYFLGRLTTTSRSDREIIRGYRGAMR